MAKVLVTGITGFTGRYVAQALNARGHKVVGMAHNVSHALAQGSQNIYKIYPDDLEERHSLQRLVADAQPDPVVPLAAISFIAYGRETCRERVCQYVYIQVLDGKFKKT